MKQKLVEHISGIFVVSMVLVAALAWGVGSKDHQSEKTGREERSLQALDLSRFHDPFGRAALGDVMDIFFPGQHTRNSKAIAEVTAQKEKEFSNKMQQAFIEEKLSWAKCLQLLPMYLKFLLVYGVVMALTYYGVQTMAVWRFCRKKRMPRSSRGSAGETIRHGAKKAATGIASFVLFCPAYVIAYSLRTELNTDTLLFMIVLCVISNGLLMVYANKFYAFMVAESRKGYVETAQVKNLHQSYEPGGADGISRRALLSPVKRFEGHVLEHIYRNAHFQYLSTLKEQASFLITGIIITEMALNLHGYLSYEMLRQMLYRNFDIVIVIILGIFYTVKATEIITDYAMHKAIRKYENT